jgi:hypothetical protein
MSLHVAPRGSKWSVRTSGKDRAWRLFPSREAAIQAAAGKSLPIYIHDKSGRLESVIRQGGTEAK